MAHYAKVVDGIVTKVIVAEPEFFETFTDNSPGEWIQTSYNTKGGIHYQPDSSVPSEDQTKALRKNFAAIGFTYDRNLDAFILPKPFASWTLNESTGRWDAPVAIPDTEHVYLWNEETQSWGLDPTL